MNDIYLILLTAVLIELVIMGVLMNEAKQAVLDAITALNAAIAAIETPSAGITTEEVQSVATAIEGATQAIKDKFNVA